TLTKAGAGVLTLSGANSYTGATSVSGGTLKAGVASVANTSGAFGNNSAITLSNIAGVALDITGYDTQIGSLTGGGTTGGNVTLGGATLTIGGNNSSPAVYGGVLSGTGGITKIGTGTLTLGGINTYTGQTTITLGTLSLDATGTIALSSGVSNNGTFTIAGAKTIDSMTGSGGTTLGANILTIGDATGSSSTYSGVLSGTGGITKAGSGTLTLSGANSYTGATSVSGGTLKAGVASVANTSGAFGNNSAITLSNTAGVMLDITDNDTQIGSLTGGGTTGGNVTLGDETLTIGGNNSSPAVYGGVLSGTGGITKIGTGTLTLGGINTYTGQTTITLGTLSLNTTGTIALSSGVSNNGTFTIAGAKTIDSMTGAGGTTLGANILTIGDATGSSSTYSGVLSGTGGITKSGAGTLTLSGTNLYTGLTTVTGGTLAYGVTNALSSGGVTVSGGGTLNLDTYSDSVGAVTLTDGSIIGSGVLTSTSGFTVSNGTVSAVLGGAVTMTKTGTGTGTVTLSGVNTYTGVTTINAGVLSVGTIGNGGVAGNLGAATNAAANLVLGGGTLQYTGATASTNRAFTLTTGTSSTIDVTANNLTISGIGANTTGALTKSGSGTLTLGAANLYTGLTTISGGTLVYGIANALASGGVTVSSGATLNLDTYSDSVGAVTLSDGSITGTGTATLTSTSGFTVSNGTVSAKLAGTVPLTKTGTGTVTLSGVNTYTGVTTINAGVLSVGTIGNGGVAGNLGAATNVAANLVLGGGTLQYTGSTASTNRAFTLTTGTSSTIDVTANNLTISGIGANTTGALTKSGAGTLTLSGANLFTGLTTISGGTLAYGITNALASGGVTVNGSGAVLDIGGYSDTVGAVTLTNGAITGTTGVLSGTGYTVSDGTVSAKLAGAVLLTKTGTGTVTLSGANTYSGGTTLSGGTLSLGSSGAIGSSGSIRFDGGALQFSSANTTDYSSRFSSAASQAYTIDTNGQDVTLASILSSNGGTLTKSGSGTLTLSGANSYTGLTTVSAGTLKLGAAGGATNTPLGTTDAGTVVSNGATLDLNGFTLGTAESVTINGTGVGDTAGALANSSTSPVVYSGSIILGSSSTIVSSGNFTASGVVTGTAGTLTLDAGTSGDIVFTNTVNDFSTVSVTHARTLSLVDSNALTLSGIHASGKVDVATLSGDLTVTGNLSTTDGSATAIRLNAGKSALAGTATGGNIIISGTPSITVGAAGIASFYSGSISGSTGLSSLVGTGTGRFRYNSDESVSNYSTALSSGKNAIYREQPTVTVKADNESKTYGTAPSLTYTLSGEANGDTDGEILSGVGIGVGGSTSTSGNYVAGSHALTPSGATSLLGYALSYSTGTLTVAQKALTISGITASNKEYDGTTAATLVTSALTKTGLVSGDVLTLSSSGLFGDKSVATGKTVTLSSTIGGSDTANYAITSQQSAYADITKANLTVTATDVTKKYGEVPSLSRFTNSTLKNSETIGSVTLKSAGTAATASVAGSPYSIVASDATGGTFSPDNYTISYVDGQLRVEGLSQTTVVPVIFLPTSGFSIVPSGVSMLFPASPTQNLSLSGTVSSVSSSGGESVASVDTQTGALSEMNGGEVLTAGSSNETVNAAMSGESSTSDISQASLPLSGLSSASDTPAPFTGVITVFIGGKQVRQTAKTAIPLPDKVLKGLSKGSGNEKVTLDNGSPLPSWLKYDTTTRSFRIISKPDNSFRIKIRIQDKKRSWVVDLSSS
ncbi:hypothetical protein G9409_11825, partial [Chlorobium sp. BLA1]|uniref:beta strand repeat-containing protein n=1 Tax=Candidatus Chlorobium masyuteum TaxID=2716876 RepID=UPI001AA04036